MRQLFAGLSLTMFVLSAIPLYRALSRPSDIWWTPHAMLVPPRMALDRVEIYIRGKPLAELLQAGELRLAQNGGSVALGSGDVGLRFNNWDRVRAEQLPLLLGYAAMCGVTAALFLLVVTGRLAYRGEGKA
jgi:hypothetical protein